MDHSGQNSFEHKGVLSKVAHRERELLAKVEEAEAAAQRSIESARREAAQIAANAEKALNEEIDSMRRASEDKRAMERDSILQAAHHELAKERAKAETHLDAAAREVVSLILPGSNG